MTDDRQLDRAATDSDRTRPDLESLPFLFPPDDDSLVTLGPRATRFARWLAGALSRHGAVLLTLVIGLSLVSVLSAISGEVYEAVMEHDDIASVDLPVLQYMVAHRTPTLNAGVTDFTDLGGPTVMPIITIVITIALVIWRRSRTPAVLMVIGTAGSLLITSLGKDLIGRLRPSQSLAVPPYEHSPSFPSGHTLNATVIAGLVVYIVWLGTSRRLVRVLSVIAGLTWAGAMGVSRVYLGHHWVTDVVVGWSLGLAWLFIVITAHQVWVISRRHSRRRSAEPVDQAP